MKNFVKHTNRSLCHMYELECIPVLTSKFGLDFVGWVNVKDAYTKPGDDITNLSTYHVSHPNKISPTDGNDPTFPTVLAFDIECMVSAKSGMPKTYKPGDKVEMISLVMTKYMSGKMDKYLLFIGNSQFDDAAYEDVTQLFFPTELELLRAFCSMIKELDPDIVTGYNIYGFDYKYIFERLSFYLEPLQNMSRLNNGTTRLVSVDWESSAYGHNTYSKVEMDGRLVVDLMLYFKRFKLEKYSLNFVSEKFLGAGKDDVHYEEIWDAFESRDPSKMSLVGKLCDAGLGKFTLGVNNLKLKIRPSKSVLTGT
ncbi:hypothetical protein K7432_018532 [Basidiobolus ranarum]|uniref:DNA polymerase delta catalytic subunit n=1 Tax=Basidiobolus ranarum TaxID=34480 RepID=A0ABR2VIW4_9FUNG